MKRVTFKKYNRTRETAFQDPFNIECQRTECIAPRIAVKVTRGSKQDAAIVYKGISPGSSSGESTDEEEEEGEGEDDDGREEVEYRIKTYAKDFTGSDSPKWKVVKVFPEAKMTIYSCLCDQCWSSCLNDEKQFVKEMKNEDGDTDTDTDEDEYEKYKWRGDEDISKEEYDEDDESYEDSYSERSYMNEDDDDIVDYTDWW